MPEVYQEFLLAVLDIVRVQCWPWEGAVGVVEEGPLKTQIHVINNWFYLGSVDDISEAGKLTSTPQGFDSDGYKILCKPIVSGKVPTVPLG